MCDFNNSWKQEAIKLRAEVAELKAQLTPPDAPVIFEKVSKDIVKAKILEVFPDYEDKIYLPDTTFLITAISEHRRFITWDNTNTFPYILNIHDCDDSTMALAGAFAKYEGWSGYPVGLVHVYWPETDKAHAIVLSVAWESFENREINVYYTEPQNDHEIAAETFWDAQLLHTSF